MDDALGQTGDPLVNRIVFLEVLAESEQRSRTLVEALPDAILVHTEDTIVFVNPFCVRLLRAEQAQQILGKDISDFVHPDNLSGIKNRIEDCFSTGAASPPTESILIACDGTCIDIEAIAIPIVWNGARAIEVIARDIGARKQAQREVQTWQQRLELAQKAGLRIGLWDWDAVENTVAWSDETYRQFGYAPNTFTGRVEDAVTRIHPDDRSRVENAIRTVIAGGAEFAQQYRILRTDGTICWIDAHGVMIRNGSTHMLGVGVDITDLKEAQLSLEESEEKYLLLLNSTAEAIYGLDLQGNCTFCNPACLRQLRYNDCSELLGKNMHSLVHHSHADGSAFAEDDCKIYVAIRDGKASHGSEETLWRADGTTFTVECWSYPIWNLGGIVGAVVSFVDISDRKAAEQELRKSEEKYRQVFENAIYGMYRSKPDGTFVDANPALVSMLGYSSREELLEKNLNCDIYENPNERKALLETYPPGGRVNGYEANWKRKDGKIIAVRTSGGVACGENGLPIHYDVIAEDITARRSLEAQLRQSQKMETVGLLAGGISHDFNNHLSVILGNAELLLDTDQSEAQKNYGNQIKKAAWRAAQLTRQLLAFSRKQVLYPTVLNLNTVVHDVGLVLQHLIGADVQIVKDLDTSLGSVRADRGQLEQILMNLATNSRDAMPDGGMFIIRTENADLPNEAARYPYAKSGPYVHLSVTDTGFGMTEEISQRIFEPFFTTKGLGHGTGLGLATAYGIVKQSVGYIWVSSAISEGTTFDIYLPRLDEEAPPYVNEPEAHREHPRGTETILLLEDEEPLRQVMCESLIASGYIVLQAGRGDQAIALARQYNGSIPLIISDVVLPDMNGPAVVAKIQAMHSEAKVLYVSGYADVPVAQQLITEGATFLQKPVLRGDLLRKIDEMLHPTAP
jgi:two-component system cell cycle sensor histidine kinase/response regulator CckA